MDAKKRPYEAPKVMRLQGPSRAAGGPYCGPGSGAELECSTGNLAAQACYSDGNGADSCGNGIDGGA